MLIVMPTTRIGYDKAWKLWQTWRLKNHEKSWYFDLMFHLFIGKINNKKYEHSTTLSSYVWKLKNENVPYRVSWDIAGRAAPFNPATNICRLCLLEKYLIMFRPAGATLNQNSEFFTTCRHKQSELLGKVKFKKWKHPSQSPFHFSTYVFYIYV